MGLSLANNQLTQSKNAVTLINKNSYEEIECIDAYWAKQQEIGDGIVVPTNMQTGIPLRAAVTISTGLLNPWMVNILILLTWRYTKLKVRIKSCKVVLHQI